MDLTMELTDVLRKWRSWQEAQRLSRRTITSRAETIRHLVDFTGAQPLEITPDDIIEFCGRSEITETSAATYHENIRAFSMWAVVTELRDDDPTMRTPRPKRSKSQPRPLLDSQIERLFVQVNRRRTYLYLLFAALAGLRVSEIARIRGEHIDLEAGVFEVLGKGNRKDTLPLHPVLIAELRRWPRVGPLFSSYVSADEHVTGKAVSAAISQVMRKAGVLGKPHQIRHWFGTALLRSGVDVRVVQTLLRHRSLATTEIYTEVIAVMQSDALNHLTIKIPGLQNVAVDELV